MPRLLPLLASLLELLPWLKQWHNVTEVGGKPTSMRGVGGTAARQLGWSVVCTNNHQPSTINK